MISEIEQHRQEIEALCREYGVERLALFGSAAIGGFRANDSDREVSDPAGPGLCRQVFRIA